MIVRVHLFALAREKVGVPIAEVVVENGASIADLRCAMAEQYPQLSSILPSVRIAVNAEYATELQVLDSTAEIALIPPVSGG